MYSKLFCILLFLVHVSNASYSDIRIDKTRILTSGVNIIYRDGQNTIGYCDKCVAELGKTPTMNRKH